MYVAFQSALILFYFTVVFGVIALARSKYHTAFSIAVIGAITIAVGSVCGGFLGGFLRIAIFGKPASLTVATAAQIVGGMAVAGLGEEIARIVVLRWRYRHRNDRLEDMVMFGAGFGGAELIYRAFTRIRALIAGTTATALMTPWGSVWSTITGVEIFIWHILLTLLVYRAVRRSHFRFLALALIVLYHVGLDFCGGMTAVLFGIGYAALLWSILTVFHVWLILRLFNFPVHAPMGPIDSISSANRGPIGT
jgi:uncharacterized membrane protein YhfC